jgi:DNA processing protein
MTDLHDFVALSLLPTRSWRHAAEHLRCGESPAAVLNRLIADRWAERVGDRATLYARAANAAHRAAETGLTPVLWNEPAYPPALAAIVDPPFVLWTQGLTTAFDRPAVAIVGSRAASPYALVVAERLAADLVGCGIVVVSGLARGVDSAAHRGALGASGSTIAVLGSGADVIYPAEHVTLAREIATTGVVVSELVPGTPPLPPFFPLRNRIISGLVRAVVVVEASEKSGSLITARCALEQGREVLAVPGNVLSGRNRGGHALVRDGAKIVESADDILEEIGMPPAASQPAPAQQDPILACLTPGEPADLDAIAHRSGVSSARLLPQLFELELRGLVARVGGGRFVRI